MFGKSFRYTFDRNLYISKSMEDTRFKLLEKIFNIFYKFGIRSVSMDDLSAELGISKKTLYKYFDNKKDIVNAVLQYSLDYDSLYHNEIAEKSLNAIDSLLELSKKNIMEISTLNTKSLYDLKKYYPEILNDYLLKKRNQMHVYISRNFDEGVRQGVYRRDLNIDLIAHLYTKRLEDVHTSDTFFEADFSSEKLFETMFEHHIRGIANAEGVKYFEERKKIFFQEMH